MTALKIVSNPYDQKTAFFSLNENTKEWQRINETNPNSRLLSTKLTDGFFPFVAAEILDALISEYAGKDKLSIVFEGTDDEFTDLKEICEESYADAVELTRSSRYLANAEDVLPEIIRIFQRITPLVQKSVSDDSVLQNKMDRFSDASNDIIPICILGNYSSGKSSFINSLLGYEILPNGNEPVTARVYQIERNDRNDQAELSFEIDGEPVLIILKDDRYKLDKGRVENELVKKLIEVLDKHSEDSIALKLNRILATMTKYEKRNRNCGLADLIKIELPIVKGWMTESPHKFVIFDTPGSNSASNTEHTAVLRRAMEGLSNGIPIFVSEIDRLDTNDSESLYEEIKQMDGFDTRFTLIVISKADSADLSAYDEEPEEEIETILGQSVPKNMYSEGIFFVSSIMGLGFKIDGEFIDEHSEEIYDEKQKKFSDPSKKFYKQLFKYNIQPSQLKARSAKAAEKHKDKIYANSGLYSVENEIMTFADKYSAYNKCKQSQHFLDDVMAITSVAIENTRKMTSENLDVLRKDLDEGMRALSDQIESKCSAMIEEKLSAYESSTLPHAEEVIADAKLEDLRELSEKFTKLQESEMQYDQAVADANRASLSVTDNLMKNVRRAIKERKLSVIREGITEFQNDLEESRIQTKKMDQIKEAADQAAADDLVNKVNADYQVNYGNAQDSVLNKSTEYWEQCTADVRHQLLTLVTDSPILSMSEKTAIGETITSYQNIDFEGGDVTFTKEQFEYSAIEKIFAFPSEKLNLDKLLRNYNQQMEENIRKFYLDVENDHKLKFSHWTDALRTDILKNIVDLNPRLSGKYRNIEKIIKDLQELEERNLKLKQYAKEIVMKIDWMETSAQ